MRIQAKSGVKKLVVVLLVIAFVFLLNRYFFPSFHSEEHRGIEYYNNNSYENFGFGLNRYGKIAMKYLPEYRYVSENSTYMDFYYKDSSIFCYEYVFIAVGVRYEKDTYVLKRDEIIKQSSDFGGDFATDTKGRLVSQKRRINGEMLYYVVEYSDADNAIMYWVVFANDDYDGNANLSCLMDDTGIIFTEFWQSLHPITTENGEFYPKHIGSESKNQ